MHYSLTGVTRVFFRPIILTGLSLFFSLSLYYFYPSSQAYWLIWSAIVFSLVRPQPTLSHHLFMLFIGGVVSAAIAFLATMAAVNIGLLAFFLFIVTVSCVSAALYFPSIFLLCFLTNLFANVSGGISVPISLALSRSGFILLGMIIVILLNIVTWQRPKQLFRHYYSEFFFFISTLTDGVFACLLKQDYKENRDNYEWHLQQMKNKVFCVLDKMDKMSYIKEPTHKKIFQSLVHLYETLLDITRLRYQLSDLSILKVCAQDLNAIAEALESILRGLISYKKDEAALGQLAKNIEELESVYQNALQVVAQEPVSFFFFLHRLRMLHQQLLSLEIAC